MSECGWDGGDCDVRSDKKLTEGEIVVIVLVPPRQFRLMKQSFLRQMSLLLRGALRIQSDENGNEMIYDWPEKDDQQQNKKGVSNKRKRTAESTVLG